MGWFITWIFATLLFSVYMIIGNFGEYSLIEKIKENSTPKEVFETYKYVFDFNEKIKNNRFSEENTYFLKNITLGNECVIDLSLLNEKIKVNSNNKIKYSKKETINFLNNLESECRILIENNENRMKKTAKEGKEKERHKIEENRKNYN